MTKDKLDSISINEDPPLIQQDDCDLHTISHFNPKVTIEIIKQLYNKQLYNKYPEAATVRMLYI